jgi:hypothetical protein
MRDALSLNAFGMASGLLASEALWGTQAIPEEFNRAQKDFEGYAFSRVRRDGSG